MIRLSSLMFASGVLYLKYIRMRLSEVNKVINLIKIISPCKPYSDMGLQLRVIKFIKVCCF